MADGCLRPDLVLADVHLTRRPLPPIARDELHVLLDVLPDSMMMALHATLRALLQPPRYPDPPAT